MEKFSNNEAELKKSVAYKKKRIMVFPKKYHFRQMGHFGPENGVTL